MAIPETGNLLIAQGGQVRANTGVCNYLYCYDQTGLVEVDLISQNSIVETHMVERLLNLPSKDFDSVIIRNKYAGPNTVRFFFGKGDYTPNADRSVVVIDDASPPVVALAAGSTIELSGSTINVTSDVASVFVPLLDVPVSNSAIILAAANINRVELTIAVKDDAANGIRIGNASVTTTKGIYIAPGQSYTVQNRGALYAIRDGAVDVAVSILESESAA